MSLENSAVDGAPASAAAAESPLVVPSLSERATPSSPVVRRPVFAKDASYHNIRSQPAPPSGPPPSTAFGPAGRPPSELLNVLDLRLPHVSPKPTNTSSGDLRKITSAPSLLVIARREKFELARKAEEEAKAQARKRIDEITGKPALTESVLTAMAKAHESVQIIQELQRLTELSRDSAAPEEMQPVEPHRSAEYERLAQNEAAARKVVEEEIAATVHDSGQRDEIRQILVEVENRTRERQRAAAHLKAEQTARDLARAKRMADIRSLAKEVARVPEANGSTAADEAEREEIGRALAAVDETRRKRMKRQEEEGVDIQQDVEKLRRRQAKREQLMRKRKDMEERLEEEASKMAQLTESAKKKGESKFMSEEAKRDAEERIRADAEAVAQLEHQAAQLATERASMQRQLAAREHEKVAEIEASSAALKAKRALVEARRRQEEEELKALTESAKREVESKMVTEAAAIAEMERQAEQLSIKRAELEAQVSNTAQVEHTLAQESQKLTDKREAMEAKMRKEEEELQKLTEEARRRVKEKMAAEAAAIADMERQANELARERETLASQIAVQRAEVVPMRESSQETSAYAIDEGATQTATLNESLTDNGREKNIHVENTTLPLHVETAEEHVPKRHPPGILSTPSNVEGETTQASAVDDRVLRFSPDATTRYEVSSYNSQPALGVTLSDSVATEEKNRSEWEQEPFPDQNPGLSVCVSCRTEQRTMSPAHLAAAAGHVTCLEEVQSTFPAFLSKLDSAGRSPLFYACANAHVEAVDMLIRECPRCCHLTDVHGDTPMHAAALAGSALSCRLLLQQGRVEVEPYNSMQLTPAHLAANNGVLEVLSQHGANLNAKDADLRTPLFVACATDRLEKAEFLCELLECGGQDLGETDKRGDTPMHAAACNGSTACLLLLLQYGVAPDLRNSKGLRPIDLASRKGQSACEKILMEYQLHHHVNNSYFDSVLFLATLEIALIFPRKQGHRRCKAALAQHEVRESMEIPTVQDDPLSRPESMLSLNRGRSVRLKHWGDWIAYEDQNTQKVFWYNHVTQISQWETPSGVRDISMKHAAKSSMRLRREGDWIEYTLPDGNVFYYNDSTNDFQWQRPDQLLPSAESEGGTDEGNFGDDAGQILAAGNGDWGAFQDASTGLIFWYNEVTGESQWDPPEAISVTDSTRQRDDGFPHQEEISTQDEVVREVTSVDELFTPR